MIKDTCLGHSGVAAPPLQKSDLESPCRTHSPHSLHAQWSYTTKCNKINTMHSTKIFSMTCMNAKNNYDNRYGTKTN
jgi:hypothetical protein